MLLEVLESTGIVYLPLFSPDFRLYRIANTNHGAQISKEAKFRRSLQMKFLSRLGTSDSTSSLSFCESHCEISLKGNSIYSNVSATTLSVIAAVTICAFCSPFNQAQQWKIDPTYIYRDSTTAPERQSDLSTATCHYKPLFGEGDPDSPPVTTDGSTLASVARFGEVVVDANGSCATVQYPQEDQIYVVVDGLGSVAYGDKSVPLKTEDFLYLPATVPHALKNTSGIPATVIIMGFHTNGYENSPLPAEPLKANIEDVPIEFVNGHPDSTHYRLLLGTADGTRDRFDVGHVVTSLFLMEIDPGGTNHPHHHINAEEIYFVLSGRGDIVAGSGTDGIEGRHPAKPGDAYFYRANATVGYYSAPGVRSRILCVRSWHPGMAPKKPANPTAH
jgi:mannose-6-phosphate isomerase-like protein (cupin superfamily)